MPLSVYGQRDEFDNKAIRSKHIKDCFLADEKYVKAPELVFALEGRLDFNYPLAIETLKEITKETTNLKSTKMVSYIPW